MMMRNQRMMDRMRHQVVTRMMTKSRCCVRVEGISSSSRVSLPLSLLSYDVNSSNNSRWSSSSSSSVNVARTLPTRHSRHDMPLAASSDQLLNLDESLLKKVAGSLYSYPSALLQESSMEKERTEAQRLSEVTRQKVEYTLRGHACLIPHSLSYQDEEDESSSSNSNMSVVERVEQMVALLERAEEESRVFCELRVRLKSQLARHNHTNDDQEEESIWRQAKLAQNFGTSTGLSIEMYDLTLDAIAVASEQPQQPQQPQLASSSQLAQSILKRVLSHDSHKDDTATTNSTSTMTMAPTMLTFNAVLRTVANHQQQSSSSKDGLSLEQLLDIATETFQSMPRRNAATFTYMFQIYERHLPESKSRSNICYALWTQVCRDGLVDLPLMEQMKRTVQSDPDYHQWAQKELQSIADLPQKYRQNAKRFRYQKNNPIY